MRSPLRVSDVVQHERDRLDLLHTLQILDSPADVRLDRITALASHMLDMPIALISLLDERRQWFKSVVGLDVDETPREYAFCRHVVIHGETLVVEDTLADHRFRDTPLVTGAPNLRFYAGAPLTYYNGMHLGTLCVLDREPRQFGPRERRILQLLAETTIDLIGRQLSTVADPAKAKDRSPSPGGLDQAALHHARASALQNLSGGVAHEFNNLLGVILANLGMTGAVPDNSALKIRIDASVRAAKRGGELTRKLLAFSGRGSVGTETMDVNQIVDDRVRAIRGKYWPNIHVSARLGRDLEEITADPGEFRAVLTALIDNAVSAMPDGGRLIVETENRTVSAPFFQDSGDVGQRERVLVSVSDDGTGMSPETAARATDPFFTTREPGSAVGLGLSIAHGFAFRHGGGVRIYSLPGRGTTVCIDLPRPSTQGDDASHGKTPEPDGQGKTVMVVDEDERLRAEAERTLSGLGFQVLTFDNAREAIAALAYSGRVDIVVADLVMAGGLSGRDVLSAAARWKPDAGTVLTTGLSERIIDQFVDPADADTILSKPYDLAELGFRINDALRDQRATPMAHSVANDGD